jgi:hypothetical protein
MARYSKEARKLIAEKLAAAKSCDHPVDQKQVIGFGIFCMKCHVRIGLLSNEEGEAKILDSLKNLVS